MRFCRLAGVLSSLAIALLVLAGAPAAGIPDGSPADLVAGLLFAVNLVPGLLALALPPLFPALSGQAQFVLLGAAWAVLSLAQWRLLGTLWARAPR